MLTEQIRLELDRAFHLATLTVHDTGHDLPVRFNLNHLTVPVLTPQVVVRKRVTDAKLTRLLESVSHRDMGEFSLTWGSLLALSLLSLLALAFLTSAILLLALTTLTFASTLGRIRYTLVLTVVLVRTFTGNPTPRSGLRRRPSMGLPGSGVDLLSLDITVGENLDDLAYKLVVRQFVVLDEVTRTKLVRVIDLTTDVRTGPCVPMLFDRVVFQAADPIGIRAADRGALLVHLLSLDAVSVDTLHPASRSPSPARLENVSHTKTSDALNPFAHLSTGALGTSRNFLLLLLPRFELSANRIPKVLVVHCSVEPDSRLLVIPPTLTLTRIGMLLESTSTTMFLIEKLLPELITLELLTLS
jgi:hypothetical protein